MQYAIHCSIRFHQNVHKHWILALGYHSFDTCSTRPHQTLVPCVFINVFSQMDQLTHLASGLELRWIPWYSNTLNETFALFFLLYSRLYSFVITTVFALLFLKTVSVSFFQDTQHNSLVNTKLNNPWEFCLRLPLHPYQCTNIIGLSSMISSVTVRTSWCPKLHPTRCHRSDSWDPWWDLWCDIILAAGTFTARCLLTLLVNFTSTSGKKYGYLRHIYTTFILGTALQNCWLAGQ